GSAAGRTSRPRVWRPTEPTVPQRLRRRPLLRAPRLLLGSGHLLGPPGPRPPPHPRRLRPPLLPVVQRHRTHCDPQPRFGHVRSGRRRLMGDTGGQTSKSSFWATLPGLITAIATLVGATGGLIGGLY